MSDPVVELCERIKCMAPIGQRIEDGHRVARALLVAWEALSAIQPMHPDMNRAPWLAGDAQQAILAIVEGRE